MRCIWSAVDSTSSSETAGCDTGRNVSLKVTITPGCSRLFPGFFVTFDWQRVGNPAYNRDRGPVWIPSVRLHLEIGKDTFSGQ